MSARSPPTPSRLRRRHRFTGLARVVIVYTMRPLCNNEMDHTDFPERGIVQSMRVKRFEDLNSRSPRRRKPGRVKTPRPAVISEEWCCKVIDGNNTPVPPNDVQMMMTDDRALSIYGCSGSYL